MITCKQVAALLTSGEVERQTLWGRLQVRLHLWMCNSCALLARQMEQIRQAGRHLRSMFESEKPLAGDQDSMEARLLRKLQPPPPPEQNER